MRRPSPAILGSLAVHGAVVALALISWPRAPDDRPIRTVASVPVSIISDVEIEAAAPDNPSEELVAEDAATAPVVQPEPVPPVPQPTPPTPPRPTPRPAEKAPAPRPTPTPRPTPPRAQPTPPRPTPPRPAPRREEPTLDLDALAGPRRPSATTGTRAATGQRGQGTASQAQGQTIDWAGQVYPNWVLNCELPGASDMRIQISVTVSSTGRITDGPTLRSPRSEPAWRAVADSALRAIRASAPFDVPPGFEGGTQPLVFRVDQACRNR